MSDFKDAVGIEIIRKIADKRNWNRVKFLNQTMWVGEDYIMLEAQKYLKELEAGE